MGVREVIGHELAPPAGSAPRRTGHPPQARMPGRKEPASTDHASNPRLLHSNLRGLCCRTPSRAHTHHVALNHDGRQANAISTAPHEAGPFIGPGTPRDGSHDPHARPRSRHESALLGQAHVRRLQRREAEGQSLCHLQEEPAAQAGALLAILLRFCPLIIHSQRQG